MRPLPFQLFAPKLNIPLLNFISSLSNYCKYWIAHGIETCLHELRQHNQPGENSDPGGAKNLLNRVISNLIQPR